MLPSELVTEMRLLVVEDHAALRQSVAGSLRKRGFAVDEAPELRTAEESAGVYSYAVVILDRFAAASLEFRLMTCPRDSGHIHRVHPGTPEPVQFKNPVLALALTVVSIGGATGAGAAGEATPLIEAG